MGKVSCGSLGILRGGGRGKGIVRNQHRQPRPGRGLEATEPKGLRVQQHRRIGGGVASVARVRTGRSVGRRPGVAAHRAPGEPAAKATQGGAVTAAGAKHHDGGGFNHGQDQARGQSRVREEPGREPRNRAGTGTGAASSRLFGGRSSLTRGKRQPRGHAGGKVSAREAEGAAGRERHRAKERGRREPAWLGCGSC